MSPHRGEWWYRLRVSYFYSSTPSSAQEFTSRDASKTSTLTAAHDGDSEAMGNSKQ